MKLKKMIKNEKKKTNKETKQNKNKNKKKMDLDFDAAGLAELIYHLTCNIKYEHF